MFARTFMALSAAAGAVAAPGHGQQLAILFVFLSETGTWSLEWVKHIPLLFFFIFFFLPQCWDGLFRGAPSLLPLLNVSRAGWWHHVWCRHPSRYQHVHYPKRPPFLPFASWDVPGSVSCAGGAVHVPERTSGCGPTACGAGGAVWDADGIRG